MHRVVFRAAAATGAIALSGLTFAPAVAATNVSEATAQSLTVSIAGTNAISQMVTASHDGAKQTKNSADTLPTIASVLPATNLLGVGVAPQESGANANGTAFACAGVAGTGGGIARVGTSNCDIEGKPLTLNLADLNLGNVVLGNDSALGSALNGIPGLGTLLDTLGLGLTGLVKQISDGLAATPLGSVRIGGSLSAIQGVCVADPAKARGTANIVDSSGGSKNTPISVTIPNGTGGTQELVVANLPANPPPNTHVLVNLDTVTQTLITALKKELETALGGALAPLGLGALLQKVQDEVLITLVSNLQALLKPLQDNVLDITLNAQSASKTGNKIDVTALDLQVLPAARQFTGSSLISGQIGRVSCATNARAGVPTATPSTTPTPTPTKNPTSLPTAVSAGYAGDAGNGGQGGALANRILVGTFGVLLVGGTGGLMAYRRYLSL